MANTLRELIQTESFWIDFLHEIVENSPLLKTQRLFPENWRRFYNKAARVFELLWGDTEQLGLRLVQFMLQEGILNPEDSVLEVGCGTGWLSLALARKVNSLIALDYSPAMLNIFRLKAVKHNVTNVEIVCDNFHSFTPDHPVDVAIAAFFPDAFSPEGIRRLESYARKVCVLVLPYSRRGFNVTQKLFENIARESLSPLGALLLQWCVGYLLNRGKFPEVRKWRWESEINITGPELLEFYRAYFEIFGFDSNTVERAFRELNITDLNTTITTDIAIIWWSKES